MRRSARLNKKPTVSYVPVYSGINKRNEPRKKSKRGLIIGTGPRKEEEKEVACDITQNQILEDSIILESLQNNLLQKQEIQEEQMLISIEEIKIPESDNFIMSNTQSIFSIKESKSNNTQLNDMSTIQNREKVNCNYFVQESISSPPEPEWSNTLGFNYGVLKLNNFDSKNIQNDNIIQVDIKKHVDGGASLPNEIHENPNPIQSNRHLESNQSTSNSNSDAIFDELDNAMFTRIASKIIQKDVNKKYCMSFFLLFFY